MDQSIYSLFQLVKSTRYLYELKDFKNADASFEKLKKYLKYKVENDILDLCERASFDLNYGNVIEILKDIQNSLREKMFDFRCEKVWAGMDTTTDELVRFCQSCKKHVYLVSDSHEYEARASAGQCVAIKSIPNEIIKSSEGGCLVTQLDYPLNDDEIGLPSTRDTVALEDAKIRQLQLHLENQDYEKIAMERWFVLYDSKDKTLEMAYKNIQLGNYELVLKNIDDYFYGRNKMYQNLQRSEMYDGEQLDDKYDTELFDMNDNDSDGAYCAACQQAPCMCSDPW